MFQGVKFPVLPMSVLEEGRESIFQTAPEELRRRVWKPWRRLNIFQGAVALVGDNSIGRGFCWKSWGGEFRIWRRRCSRPDGDLGSLNVCCIYLVGYHVGGDWLQCRGRELRRQERIIDQKTTSEADIWTGSILVWDIWIGINFSWVHWRPWSESWGGHALCKAGTT